jgi:hypothetical protein
MIFWQKKIFSYTPDQTKDKFFLYRVGSHHIHFCKKCFDTKNVVVASSDIEIYSVVQGDKEKTDRPCKKKLGDTTFVFSMMLLCILWNYV